MYVILWEYQVRPGAEPAFEALYGPAGGWDALFRQAPGYLGTELLRSREMARRYLTIDRWESETAYQQFRTTDIAGYARLDSAGEALTEIETQIGAFRTPDG